MKGWKVWGGCILIVAKLCKPLVEIMVIKDKKSECACLYVIDTAKLTWSWRNRLCFRGLRRGGLWCRCGFQRRGLRRCGLWRRNLRCRGLWCRGIQCKKILCGLERKNEKKEAKKNSQSTGSLLLLVVLIALPQQKLSLNTPIDVQFGRRVNAGIL